MSSNFLFWPRENECNDGTGNHCEFAMNIYQSCLAFALDFPVLQPLFSHVFCVPTSSVPAERKFIQWGRIFSQVSLNIVCSACRHNHVGTLSTQVKRCPRDTCLPCASRSLITLVVVTYARQHVVILLFQPQGRSDTVLAASLWQDRPPGILFLHLCAAAILHPRSVVIWKLNCLPGRITNTFVTVSSCKSGRT